MSRQSRWSRLRSALAPQRKLFLLVFLWTCLCLLVFKSILFNSADQYDGSGPTESIVILPKLHARSAASNGPLAEPFMSAASSTPHSAQVASELAPELAKQSARNKDAPLDGLAGRIVDPSAFDDIENDAAMNGVLSQQVQPVVDSLENSVIQQPPGLSDKLNPSSLKYQLDSNSAKSRDNNPEQVFAQTKRRESSASAANDERSTMLLPGSRTGSGSGVSDLPHSLASSSSSSSEELKQQAIASHRNNHYQEFTSNTQPSFTSSSNSISEPGRPSQQQTATKVITTATTNSQNPHRQQATSGNKSRNSNNNNNNSNKKPNNNLSDAQFRERNAKHTNEQLVPGGACHYEFPNLFDLQFNNIYWQKLTTKLMHGDDDDVGSSPRGATHINSTTTNINDGRQTNASTEATFYLYNAYYDNRWRAGLPSVRVLAMIDRIQPPPTNCLLWSSKLRGDNNHPQSSSSHSNEDNNNHNGATTSQSNGNPANPTGKLFPLVTRAQFVYAWYPKWGNYKDGILQPWIITCPLPQTHVDLVPDSVSLVEVRREIRRDFDDPEDSNSDDGISDDSEPANNLQRDRREALSEPIPASIAMPPSFSSSSPALASASSGNLQTATADTTSAGSSSRSMSSVEYECEPSRPITNNLIVYNNRPERKQKFAVCVKGLDFPHEDVSVRLVEWIELLNLLGASKIFLYELDVHENISKVLDYYRRRGIVELTPLTLPGDQPNLPEYQHIYLKSKLTAKRQNELIPYNDCLYRNLNSYQYLALLDIDEIIMPLHHHNWYDLMSEVETRSLSEQNYSRASYNVRNVYFFDDLSGPLGTTSTSSSSASSIESSDISDNNNDSDKSSASSPSSRRDSTVYSLERGIPHYLHMMSHVYRSKNYTEPGQYVKCFHNTERIVSLHNHFPMNCFGQCTTYSIPVNLAHLQHYRKDCVGPLKQSCKRDFRVFTTRDTTIWKYNQPMIKRTTRVLNQLGLLRKNQ